MATIKTILVPTDFSPFADAAVDYAAGLAGQFGADLVLVNVIPDMELVLPDGIMPQPVALPDFGPVREEARKSLDRTIAGKGLARFRARAETRLGSPAEEIAAAAGDLHADLIVIPTHGRTGLAHFFLGSTAEKVVRTAPCPVLTFRPNVTE